MSFFEAVAICFHKWLVLRGRAARSEYWYFTVFGLLVAVISRVLPEPMPFLGMLIGLAMAPAAIAVSVRRLHDVDRSGIFLLLPSVPLLAIVALASTGAPMSVPLGAIDRYRLVVVLLLMALAFYAVLIVWFCKRGTLGPNRFSDDPTPDLARMTAPRPEPPL